MIFSWLTAVVLLLPAPAPSSAVTPAETKLLDLAYAAIDAHQDALARTYLLSAGAAAPRDAKPRKELFYVDLRLGRPDEAFGQAHKAQALGDADPAFRLDVAYALDDAHRSDDAQALLRSLLSSEDPRVRNAAQAQLAADEAADQETVSANAPSASPDTDSPPAPASADPVLDQGLQHAYDASDRGDHAAALASLDAYLQRVPGDEKAQLQRAYELLALGRQTEADAALEPLEHASDADVARAARVQLAVDRRPTTDRGDVYTYYQREGRFGGDFYGGDVLVALGSGSQAMQPYVAVHADDDSGTAGTPVRQTLTDRLMSVDVGARTHAGANGWLYAEAGNAFGLAGQVGMAEARYGYETYREWGAASASRPHTALDVDASVYSRYAGNAIAYGQVTHDVRLTPAIRGVVELNLAADTHRLYYNNTLEGAAGVQIGSPSLGIRLLTVRGAYMPRGAGRPASTTYATARTQLLFGLSF